MKRLSIVAAALLLSACAAPTASPSPGPTQTTEAPKVLKPGTFSFEASGAKGTLAVPGKPVAEVEALRALVNAAPAVTYLTVHVDNRQGTEAVNMYGVSLFTPAGEELRYEGVSTYIGSIRPGDAPAETYNKFINASNKHLDMADPHEVKDFVLTGPPVPAEFTAVTVYPTGAYDPVEAVPAS